MRYWKFTFGLEAPSGRTRHVLTSILLFLAPSGRVAGQADTLGHGLEDLEPLRRSVVPTTIAFNAVNGQGGETKLARAVPHVRFKEPRRRVDRIGQLRHRVGIVLEVIGVAIDETSAPVRLVVVAPTQLDVATAVIGQVSVGHDAAVRAALIVVPSTTARRGGDFLLVFVRTRLPDGVGHKGELTVERVRFRHVVDGDYEFLGGTLRAALELIIPIHSGLQVLQSEGASGRTDSARTTR
jgi:hypothetical protein